MRDRPADEVTSDPVTNDPARSDPVSSGVSVISGDFHAWKAIVLRNRVAEIVVVPDIGRVMRFHALDAKGESASGPFWHDARIKLDKRIEPDAEGWTNYGGDKAWPAPQADWARITGHGWPPPKAFDAQPFTATVKARKVQLVSAVDRDYGLRMRRTIGLDSRKPVMTIETAYEKVRGQPVHVGVWTITQLKAPERVFILLPWQERSALPGTYKSLLPDPPQDLRVEDLEVRDHRARDHKGQDPKAQDPKTQDPRVHDRKDQDRSTKSEKGADAGVAGSQYEARLLSMSRDPQHKTMLKSNGHALLWVGDGPNLLIEDETNDPEAGSQIYTSPGAEHDDQSYVELELLGRTRDLAIGEKVTLRSRYTLLRRTESDSRAEAKRVFADR
jgi:hypothetical protein